MPGIVVLTFLVVFLCVWSFFRVHMYFYQINFTDKLIHCAGALAQISSNTNKLCAWSDGNLRIAHRIQLVSMASLLLYVQRCVDAIV